MSVADRRLFFLSRSCRGASVSPDTSCRRGTYFFTYGLPVASSRCLAIVRKRPLASVRCSVPPGASAIRATDAAGESSASRLKHCRTARRKAKPTPMVLGCCVGCATKKVSKKVAGNAIPRSRLPSERKIAHSRSSSLYPCFDTNVRNRKYFLNLQLILWSEPAGSQQAPRSCRPPPGVAPACAT